MITLGDIQKATDNYQQADTTEDIYGVYYTPHGNVSYHKDRGLTGNKESIDWIIKQEQKYK